MSIVKFQSLAKFPVDLPIIIMLSPWEFFFTPALADGLLQDFEWQQVSSSLRDSSQYSERFQPYCSLDGLN